MHHPHLLVDDNAIYSLSSKAKDIVEGNRTIRAIEVVIMAENLTNTQSNSKRVKKNSAFESNEQLKLQLDSEKSLHEVQCFTEELLSTRKTCARGTVLTSFTDPMVNLNIDLLMNRIRSSGNELEHRAKLNLPGTMETLLQKLSTENDDLRRKVSINLINEKLSLKKVRL